MMRDTAPDMTPDTASTSPAHRDTGFRCMVYHGPHVGPCIKCACGQWVPPAQWAAHVAGEAPEHPPQG
jgi:hypothetical protein